LQELTRKCYFCGVEVEDESVNRTMFNFNGIKTIEYTCYNCKYEKWLFKK